MPNQNEEVLLRVEHLCQYFKSTKAVDDISFDIKKGEVFGLVGESGCGKTTTGRSIIKLYDITSGNIYFKGKRIAAGTLSYKEAIKKAREEMKSASPDRQAELKGLIDEQRQLMKEAKHDHKHCDQMYADVIAKEVAAKYEPLLAAAPDAEKPELKKRYLDDMRVAK